MKVLMILVTLNHHQNSSGYQLWVGDSAGPSSPSTAIQS